MLIVKNGNVWLGQGQYEAGWDVLCEGGLIKSVGPDLSVDGAEVIDAAGMDIYPGFVLPLCAVGATAFSEFGQFDVNETSNPIVPQMNIRHSFDLRELKRQRFARAGITSYGLSPGKGSLIAGQMAFVHINGNNTRDVFLANSIALKGNFTKAVKSAFGDKNRAPMTRMAMYQMLNEAFRDAQEYLDKNDKNYDEGKEIIGRVLRREIPFVVNAATQSEIESVCEIGKKYNLNLIICGAYGIKNCVDEILAQNWNVILGDSSSHLVGVESKTNLRDFVELYRKGLKLSLFCSGDEAYPGAYEQLSWVAALMHRAGATGDEIMDMMTINPARALGVDTMVGSIAAGKQADMIICRGNPVVRFDNFIEHTIVAGKALYRREAN